MGKISSLDVPTLFISTDDDQIAGPTVPMQEIKDNIQRVSFVSINRGNHLGTVLQDGNDLVSLIALKYADLDE